MLNEIKVIIDGSLYNHKIVQLEGELEGYRNRMAEEVEKRVQELMKLRKEDRHEEEHEHDYEKCVKCKKLMLKCPNCQAATERCGMLERMVSEKE
jgi:hypothetical protein